jgi:hypothetical protein
MQNVTGSPVLAPSDDRDDVYRTVVADLTSLIEQIQTSLTRIDAALASEAAATVAEPAANVVVLDDVTPRYLKAGAALKACDARLGMALHFLREPMVFQPCTNDSAGGNHLPAHRSAASSHSTIN